VIYSVTLHFDSPKLLIAFQAVMDGQWADMGWHNVFLASPQCQMSPKSALWEPHWYIWTDGRTWQR